MGNGLRLGSRVKVLNPDTGGWKFGKVISVLADRKVFEVELDTGGFITAGRDGVKPAKAEG